VIGNMTKLKVVLDTKFLVAASRSRRGASFAVMQHLRQGNFIALASVPLFLEYESVLKRSEQLAVGSRTPEMVDAFLDALSLRTTPVHLHFLWRPQTRDPADEMVLETALNGNADALITFNLNDFVAAKRFKLPVWMPSVLLNHLNLKES
jgi:putative PIN family toxin of toxin-antitoxin system